MFEITIVIKTFKRKKALTKLLKSIEKYYPQLPIIILDDSKRNYRNYIKKKFSNLNINYIVEEFNIGLSKGRNILLKNVLTKYFLLCDDDFEFDERTNLEVALKMYKDKKVDILGGLVYNRFSLDSLYSILWSLKNIKRFIGVLKKEEFCSIYNGKYTIKDNNVELLINKNLNDYNQNKVYMTDICSNFFIGDTEKILSIGGWTPELLKVGEHEIFFFKAKKHKLKVGYTSCFGVIHYPKKTFNYMRYRFKAEGYFRTACKEENLKSFIVKDNNTNNVIYSYKK